MRQTSGQSLPFVAARPAAVDAQLAIVDEMLRVTLDRNNVNGLRLVRVDVDHESEVGREIAADLLPRLARVVAAHHVPMLLHVQHRRPRRVHRHVVHAMTNFGTLVGDAFGLQAAVHRPPRRAGVVRPERARG